MPWGWETFQSKACVYQHEWFRERQINFTWQTSKASVLKMVKKKIPVAYKADRKAKMAFEYFKEYLHLWNN